MARGIATALLLLSGCSDGSGDHAPISSGAAPPPVVEVHPIDLAGYLPARGWDTAVAARADRDLAINFSGERCGKLGRVEVQELRDRVVVTLFATEADIAPDCGPPSTRYTTRIRLRTPLGDRRVVDGGPGRHGHCDGVVTRSRGNSFALNDNAVPFPACRLWPVR